LDIIIGSDNKLSLVELATQRLGKRCEKYINVSDIQSAQFEKMQITKAPRTRAYVKIEDGCEARCTYCAIPGARGKVRSKAPDDVVSEVEALYKNGVREIVLTGIETGSYGKDFDYKFDLGDLIALLDKRGSCERIRLGSLAPELVGEAFVDKIKDVKTRFDASEHGGAPLLGIAKPVIKAHGSSDANAIMNAVRQAINFVETGINNDIIKFAEDYDEKKLLADADRIYGNV
jgi:tRNA A37 methylthiotransferase MiaB